VLLHKFRERGLAAAEGADDSIGWFEWSAEPGADITDKEAWYQSNPALAIQFMKIISRTAFQTVKIYSGPKSFANSSR
jgi:hypothetical protein